MWLAFCMDTAQGSTYPTAWLSWASYLSSYPGYLWEPNGLPEISRVSLTGMGHVYIIISQATKFRHGCHPNYTPFILKKLKFERWASKDFWKCWVPCFHGNTSSWCPECMYNDTHAHFPLISPSDDPHTQRWPVGPLTLEQCDHQY